MPTLVPTPHPIIKHLACLGAALVIAGCTEGASPATPTSVSPNGQPAHVIHNGVSVPALTHNKAADDKGYIDGWFDGETVQLHYTKLFFCAEPPESGADSGCEIGAEPEVVPRPGPIPTIYAIAAVGIQPDVATLACPPRSVCLNHPAMIDVSRVRPGATNVAGLPHSHIAERRAGWFNTVNIRVSNLDVWNPSVMSQPSSDSCSSTGRLSCSDAITIP